MKALESKVGLGKYHRSLPKRTIAGLICILKTVSSSYQNPFRGVATNANSTWTCCSSCTEPDRFYPRSYSCTRRIGGCGVKVIPTSSIFKPKNLKTNTVWLSCSKSTRIVSVYRACVFRPTAPRWTFCSGLWKSLKHQGCYPSTIIINYPICNCTAILKAPNTTKLPRQ